MQNIENQKNFPVLNGLNPLQKRKATIKQKVLYANKNHSINNGTQRSYSMNMLKGMINLLKNRVFMTDLKPRNTFDKLVRNCLEKSKQLLKRTK